VSNELITGVQSLQLTTLEDVKKQVQAIEACVKTVMVANQHYGKIPGCGDKPTLLKPGAELLAKLFQIRPEFKRERIDLGNGHIQILSSCIMYSRITGSPVGEGAGNCSTMESKYRWRKAQRSCPSCGVEGSISRSKFPPKNDKNAQPGWYCRDCKTQFDYDSAEIRNQKTERVENPDIADQYNTVQKIADKRAYIAAVITTTGASDYVTQDLEDFADNFKAVETTAEVISTEPTPQPAPITPTGSHPQESLEPPIEGKEKARQLTITSTAVREAIGADNWEACKKVLCEKYTEFGTLSSILLAKHEEIIAEIKKKGAIEYLKNLAF
jgi:hypothetical protein